MVHTMVLHCKVSSRSVQPINWIKLLTGVIFCFFLCIIEELLTQIFFRTLSLSDITLCIEAH